MKDKNINTSKSAVEILPEDKKHLKNDMPDHLKSPLNELKDKKEVLKNSSSK